MPNDIKKTDIMGLIKKVCIDFGILVTLTGIVLFVLWVFQKQGG